MTVPLIEFLLGVYFLGVSISVVLSSRTVDIFKLVLAVILIVLALTQGVKIA